MYSLYHTGTPETDYNICTTKLDTTSANTSDVRYPIRRTAPEIPIHSIFNLINNNMSLYTRGLITNSEKVNAIIEQRTEKRNTYIKKKTV
jgi:hypothetical protein